MLSEMDVTGQAFEDMQEQNSRLLQQLREKDDANFKLMSERIKSNQIYKLLKEEKEELADQVLTFKTQVQVPPLQTRSPPSDQVQVLTFRPGPHLKIRYRSSPSDQVLPFRPGPPLQTRSSPSDQVLPFRPGCVCVLSLIGRCPCPSGGRPAAGGSASGGEGGRAAERPGSAGEGAGRPHRRRCPQ